MSLTAAVPPIAITDNRRGLLTTSLVALAAFGPYLVGGFRTEQVVVYLTAVALIALAACARASINAFGLPTAGLWGFLFLTIGVGAWDPPRNTTRFALGSAFAGLDNYALPLAVIIIASTLVGVGADREALIRRTCLITAWAMMVNAVLALMAASGHGPNLDRFHLLGDVESVAYRAETMGRFCGLFNQPAEAGLLYSVALLGIIYLYQRRPVLLAVCGTLVTVGGVLTISKVFLLVGLPIGAWQILRASGGRQRRVTAIVVVALAAWAAAKAGVMPAWAGSEFLLRLLPSGNQDAVDLYTAGRLGGGSTLAVVVDAVANSSPIWGFGAAGLQVAYDNAWVEAIVVGGFVGAAVYTAILAILIYAWWRQRSGAPEGLGRLSGGLVLVVVGASVGIPALTVNRCATVVWLLLTLLLLAGEQKSAPSQQCFGAWRTRT